MVKRKKSTWILICIGYIVGNYYPLYSKKALIWGITGQDGIYLTTFLLNKGYEVHGVIRKDAQLTQLAEHLERSGLNIEQVTLHTGTISNEQNVYTIIHTIQPDEVYNLAAQSQVGLSFQQPVLTMTINGLGPLYILEAIKQLGLAQKIRYFQAATSELFGKIEEKIKKEQTPFYPTSPYGISKLLAYWLVVNYRETYNVFACNGILFNHESPLRGNTFLTKIITEGVVNVYRGIQDTLYIGNLNIHRDWGFAGDYVEAMWLMLQQDTPQDLVIATGETHSLKEFIESAFKEVGITLAWQGSGIHEIGIDTKTNKTVVQVNPYYFRPSEISYLYTSIEQAKNVLGWQPTLNFKGLVNIMIRYNLERIINKKIQRVSTV